MPGGAFNTSKFIEELGLKPVGPDEMRVRTEIQPVLIAGDLSATTPAHQQPSAMFGAVLVGAAATAGQLELQCMSLGGGFVEGMVGGTGGAEGVRLSVNLVGTGLVTVVAAAGQLSRNPVLSIVRQGAVAPSGDPNVLFRTTFNRTVDKGFNSFYVPHGSFFLMECQNVNTTIDVGFLWREVVPAENVPA